MDPIATKDQRVIEAVCTCPYQGEMFPFGELMEFLLTADAVPAIYYSNSKGAKVLFLMANTASNENAYNMAVSSATFTCIYQVPLSIVPCG